MSNASILQWPLGKEVEEEEEEKSEYASAGAVES